jgi:hypothetical protein
MVVHKCNEVAVTFARGHLIGGHVRMDQLARGCGAVESTGTEGLTMHLCLDADGALLDVNVVLSGRDDVVGFQQKVESFKT